MLALLVGRFHALTRAQGEWILSLGRDPSVERIVCALTSADHVGTRRNPLDAETRAAMLEPALAAAEKPFKLVRVNDIPDDQAWPAHVARVVGEATGWPISPESAVVYTANRSVAELFARDGYRVAQSEAGQVTPHELIRLIVEGKPWSELAAPSTLRVYQERQVEARLREIFAQHLRNDDGELAEHRDFASYGAQMDLSLQQKLDDLLPWVKPGRIVDKGCGTGKLLVELSRQFPSSSLVGVDLSREFLRRCDENTYASGDVELLLGEAAGQELPDDSATTVIFSSVMHEIYSYSGYDLSQIDRALASAFRELASGGRVLMRDGVSPPPARWRLKLLDQPTREAFRRFAAEFKRGRGAPYRKLEDGWLLLDAHLVNEFLCKKDYQTNWHIEVHEEYGALTLEGWGDALERAGFRVLSLKEYCNDWIVEHRYLGHSLLTDEEGTELPWPATNAVVVGEKP
jgi:ubiquinone/menaquinone biosynthesis C-methylase UbiE/nicotinamide mononucleotide adenylyltransferase